jgi:acetylornithine deacetylase/succinyl-diaminopimelate desuccinylase-like protein
MDRIAKGLAVVPAVAIALCAMATVGAQRPDLASALLRDRAVSAALAAARDGERQTIDDQVRYCEIPAPTFGEALRAEALRRTFVELGLQNVHVDRAGNVIGSRPGLKSRPHLVVAAHLDTVFPADTDVRVRREGPVMRGPGIGDNCRGLAVLVAIVRAMRQADVQTPGSITFAANVGEEGLGDLSGMRAFFADRGRAGGSAGTRQEVDRFVSIDGSGLHVTHIAVGSHRYRVTFKGPGGHSFGAFGLPNPIGALGRAVAKINEFQVPGQPRTTFNVGRIGGGTSINSIPSEAWMEVDMRSSDPATLASLDARFQRAVDEAVAEENGRWGRREAVTAVKELVGNRPAGSISQSSPIVQTAQAAGRALGLTIPLGEGSTDANIPISLNIPAITIGGGGSGVNPHALTESFDSTDSWKGTQHALLVTITLARD